METQAIRFLYGLRFFLINDHGIRPEGLLQVGLRREVSFPEAYRPGSYDGIHRAGSVAAARPVPVSISGYR